MSYTNTTPNYKLPQYVPTDKPTYLGDANTAYRIIDTSLAETAQKAQNAVNTVQNITLDTESILSQVSEVKQSTTTMRAEITSNSKAINTNGTSISNLNTTVQSLSTSLAEANKDITKLKNDVASIDSTISTSDFKKMLLNTAYPIGSIYISTSSTNPSNLLGGSWTSINGRFLIGQGSVSTYTGGTKTISAGSTGGAYETYLSDNNSPYKEARDEAMNDLGLVSGKDYPASFGDRLVIMKGNNAQDQPPYIGQTAVNLMPPYLAVYMWKRTA